MWFFRCFIKIRWKYCCVSSIVLRRIMGYCNSCIVIVRFCVGCVGVIFFNVGYWGNDIVDLNSL